MNRIGKNIKTISTNVSMDMVDDVLHFHNKGNIYLDNQFFRQVAPCSVSYDQLCFLERSDFEIVPFYDDAIACHTDEAINISRLRSAQNFSAETIDFSALKSLLSHAFAMRTDESRPYPSGGALYPVEVICIIFSERMTNAPQSGFYHYRPTLNMLQPIKTASSEEIRQVVFNMELSEVKNPSFAFLYVGVVGKMLVKYRYRGYRYALMESGAMFQQADLVAQSLEMANKLYSGFNDHELMKFIGLDRMNFLPLVIQSFGKSI